MAFREEYVAVRRTVFLRVSYDVCTVWSRLVRTVYDVRDDSSAISGDACTVIQDATTIVLRLLTFCVRCRYDLVVYLSRLESYGIVRSRDCS